MKTIRATELSNLKMVAGNENKYEIVIDSGRVKQWVAIGWIVLRAATEADKKKYPKVTHSPHWK